MYNRTDKFSTYCFVLLGSRIARSRCYSARGQQMQAYWRHGLRGTHERLQHIQVKSFSSLKRAQVSLLVTWTSRNSWKIATHPGKKLFQFEKSSGRLIGDMDFEELMKDCNTSRLKLFQLKRAQVSLWRYAKTGFFTKIIFCIIIFQSQCMALQPCGV